MKVKRNSWKTKFRYWFDNTLSSGAVALIAWLGLFSIIIVFIASAVVTIMDIDPQEKNIGFPEAFWISLMRTLDPGNLSNDNGWPFRIVMLTVTVVGILIVSTLIGLVNSGIAHTLENLRKGRSIVNEKDHTLILGWSPMIFSLVRKIIAGHKGKKKLCIVILADKDKIEMEDEIHSKIRPGKKVRIICRSGSSLDPHDIEIVNPHHAHSIVLLTPDEDKHDIYAIKSILALIKSHNRKSEKYNIITEIKDPANLEVIEMIGNDEVTPIISEELFSRITVQTSLQSGLSEVYNELLDFKGIEIQFINSSELIGISYYEALSRFEEGGLIGIRRPDSSIEINAKPNSIIGPNDQLIVITQTRKGIHFRKENLLIQKNSIVVESTYKRVPQRTLLLGWNSKAPGIIRELDFYFVKGSEVVVCAETDTFEAELEVIKKTLVNQKVTSIKGKLRDKNKLMELNPCGYQHVIILCYSEIYDLQSADALTLITLLHLRKIAEENNCKFTIVSEMFDLRNRSLAEVTHADDFIVSDRLISMVMAQLASNIELKHVFDELLNPGGSEIYMRPITDYVKTDEPVNFYTVVESALAKNQTVIGYRLADKTESMEDNYGVVLAPSKKEIISFNNRDKAIVIMTLE
jgi:hypothetical protein